MGSNCEIAKKFKDGHVVSIYCHNYGSIEGVGKRLLHYYATEEKIDKLLSLGNISILGMFPESDPSLGNSCNSISDKCKTYAGRGDALSSKSGKSLEEFYLYLQHSDRDYAYVGSNGEGQYSISLHGFRYGEFLNPISESDYGEFNMDLNNNEENKKGDKQCMLISEEKLTVLEALKKLNEVDNLIDEAKKDLTKEKGTIANLLTTHMEEIAEITEVPKLKDKVVEIIQNSNVSEKTKRDAIKKITSPKNYTAILSTIGTYITGIKVE